MNAGNLDKRRTELLAARDAIIRQLEIVPGSPPGRIYGGDTRAVAAELRAELAEIEELLRTQYREQKGT